MELGPVRGGYASAETLKEAEKAMRQSLLGGVGNDDGEIFAAWKLELLRKVVFTF